MRPGMIVKIFLLAMGLLAMTHVYSQKSAPIDPMDQGSWVIGVGVGPGTPVSGNGYGFGPGFKVFVENGTWQLGPGVLSLGGEVGFSFFSYHWVDRDIRYHESWVNYMFGARSAYHYGWDVKGLDTYAGIPLGIGFSTHNYDNVVGYKGGNHPVFPYFGLFVGTSYFFNNQIGINGELGYNVTYANIGVIFKLR
jgi:hypothetical protein